MMQSSVTLKQISILSGYSVSTVSKALNNKEDVNSATRKLIMEIAKNNNYVPNAFAIALRKQKTSIIAVILPKTHDVFYSALLCSIQKKASKLGYRVLLFQSFEKLNDEKAHLLAVNDGSVDGVIILSTNELSEIIELVSLPVEYVYMNPIKNDTQSLTTHCIDRFENFMKAM